jgi:hypothetical protein
MRIWCIKIGIVLVLHLNARHLHVGHKTITTAILLHTIFNSITDVISNFIRQNVIGINIELITARVAN